LATVPSITTTFDTEHPYDIAKRLYSISAVDSNGNESIMAEIIDNQTAVITNHKYK